MCIKTKFMCQSAFLTSQQNMTVEQLIMTGNNTFVSLVVPHLCSFVALLRLTTNSFIIEIVRLLTYIVFYVMVLVLYVWKFK